MLKRNACLLGVGLMVIANDADAQGFGFCDTPSPAEFNERVPDAQTTAISTFAQSRFAALSRAPRIPNSAARQASARLARTQTTITYDGLIDAFDDALTDFNTSNAAQTGSAGGGGSASTLCTAGSFINDEGLRECN
ncbi:MAG: hypothetical protein AAGF56_05290 [Pseudomonadota bacterium]